MKIIRACYSPLLDIAQAVSSKLYQKMLLIKSFPAQRVIVTSEPSLTSRVVSIIKCPDADPATHSILMVDHPGFTLVNAVNEYINGNPYPTVTWTGGKPPYRFWVSYRPKLGIASDDILGTKIVNLAPEYLKATIGPPIFTMQGIITKNINYYDDGWWADDGNGELPQDEIGIVIEDSSDTPMQIFAPFTPLETDPNYPKYTGAGHSYGPDTSCPCPFEFILSSSITYGEDIIWLSEPRGRVPGTNDEVAGTFGVYTDEACTQVANLVLPNSGTYLLFVQFVPDDTTHLKTNVKQQTVVAAKATQGPLTYDLISIYGIDNFFEIVGEIGFYQIFGSHPTSGNRVLMFADPAENEIFSFNGVAQNQTFTDVNGVIHSNVFGVTGTYANGGWTTYTVYQEGSANYEASADLTFMVRIYPVGFRQTHTCIGGGVGGGYTETINFYPEKHVCEGGGVGGGHCATFSHQEHTCRGGGVGGGTTETTQGKADQTISSFRFFNYYGKSEVNYAWIVAETAPTIVIVTTCTSELPINLIAVGSALDIDYGTYSTDTLEVISFVPPLSGPGTFKTVKLKSPGTLDITASQAGNAYWNAAIPINYEIVMTTPKKILTVSSITWIRQFTATQEYAEVFILLSENVFCQATISTGNTNNLAILGSGQGIYTTRDGIHYGTEFDMYSNMSTSGSYICNVYVVGNPMYADFYYSFVINVRLVAKTSNVLTGMPSYFLLNQWNQIGNIRLSSMTGITNSTAITGTNKVHYVTGQSVAMTLGSTPVFGGSPLYTSGTVFMGAFNSGCTLRVQHPGDTAYFPFDATYLLTAAGAILEPPGTEPPVGDTPQWHITNYQCNAATLFVRYDAFNTSNNIYGTWRRGAEINGSAAINAYVTIGWNDLYYHPSHDGDFAANFLGLTDTQFYTAFIAPIGHWNANYINTLWQFHIKQIEYYY